MKKHKQVYSITVDKLDLLGEQLAHVDACADDSIIARPDPSFQTQRRSRCGKLFGRERVMDAVSVFGDGEDPWNVHVWKSPYGCESIRS